MNNYFYKLKESREQGEINKNLDHNENYIFVCVIISFSA
jgi:hypothetical protein